MDRLQAAFEDFSASLTHRFELGIPSSEDAVRYTCFHALLSHLDCGPERLILERPHPNLERALIDAWILPCGKDPDVALEFKFHRLPPGKTTAIPRPMQAGSVIRDIFKLCTIQTGEPVVRLLVYVCGPELAGYWHNPGNGLHQLFDLGVDEGLAVDAALLEGRSQTLLNQAGMVAPATVTMLHTSEAGQFAVRVYRVEPLIQPA